MTLAECVTRILTTSFWPARLAMCKAVLPFFVAESIFAPLASSSVTMLLCPSLLARCKALSPFWGRQRFK